jgi:16S rRNA (cytosine1402-N4)-methyltransferase
MMQNDFYHAPVMPKEAGDYLVRNPHGCYIDGTAGGGGHSAYLLSRFPDIRVIALDWDAEAIEEATRTCASYGDRFRICRENFKNIPQLLEQLKMPSIDGILLDLGVSSRQFDRRERGFSFQSAVLDMRMDQRGEQRAVDLVNTLPEDELADMFFRLGEERLSRPISRLIVRERVQRPIASGEELATLVARVKKRRGKIHPATQVFQALRIAVNRELDNLAAFIEGIPHVLVPGGRVVIISYHSLEDRMVKLGFRKLHEERQYQLLTKKVVVPSPEEMRQNPRSRSAKLRALESV